MLARFVEEHRKNGNAAAISVFGQDKNRKTTHLAKMNLAVHGLSGDIVAGNTYYTDPHNSVGRYSACLANPPFNVNRIDKERIKDDPRFPYGIPSADNGNYLWIQIFSTALNGRRWMPWL
jgi:type I restriction enzyme M protein